MFWWNVLYTESIVSAATASAQNGNGTSWCSNVFRFCGEWAWWWRCQWYQLNSTQLYCKQARGPNKNKKKEKKSQKKHKKTHTQICTESVSFSTLTVNDYCCIYCFHNCLFLNVIFLNIVLWWRKTCLYVLCTCICAHSYMNVTTNNVLLTIRYISCKSV